MEDFAALAKKGPPRDYRSSEDSSLSSEHDLSAHNRGRSRSSGREMSALIEGELERVFGYRKLRGLQEQVIKTLLNGQDVFAVMPTGAGKSLCYQVGTLFLPKCFLPALAVIHSQTQWPAHFLTTISAGKVGCKDGPETARPAYFWFLCSM